MRKDPTEFRKRFAKWKEGGKPYKDGKISDELYVSVMEKVAADNWLQWGDESEDAALTRILNDNAYDYRGYYNDNPESAANVDTHWPDKYKTVWHPTFSNQSKYSGKKSQYNPYGYPGGTWQEELFNPQWYLLSPHGPGFYKDGYPKLPKFRLGTEGYKYVQAGKNNEWSRITNDDMSLAFLNLVVRPKSRGGNTTEGNWNRLWTPKYEKPLESVSPEFDIISGIRGITNLLKPKQGVKSDFMSYVDTKPANVSNSDIAKAVDLYKAGGKKPTLEMIDDMVDVEMFYASPQYRSRAISIMNGGEKEYNDALNAIHNNFLDVTYEPNMPAIISEKNGQYFVNEGALGSRSHNGFIQILKNLSEKVKKPIRIHELFHQSGSKNGVSGELFGKYNQKYKLKPKTEWGKTLSLEELSTRIKEGLLDMQNKLMNINSERAIQNYLGGEYELFPPGVLHLIDNFEYSSLLPAFKNVLGFASPVGISIPYLTNTRNEPRNK